jgi:hypothetical protein
MSGLLGFGRDTLQAMSNNAAGLLSGPVDLINLGLLKAGLPMPANPVGGSASLRAAGLTRPVENQYAQALGDTLGNVLPIVAAAKGPQIAQGLLQAGENLRAPTPLNAATRGQAGAIVYHGSPHKFDKFDSSKIGTGEGAQSFGHGLYFAQNPATAKEYQKQLAGIKLTYADDATRAAANKTMPWGFSDPVAVLKGALGTDANVPQAIKTLRTAWAKDEYQHAHANHLANLLEKGLVKPQVAGNLYKVDLPDDAIARMVDWDKPLYRQAPAVRRAVRDIVETQAGPGTYAQWTRNVRPDFQTLRTDMLENLPEPQIAELLRQRGVAGIRYLDGVSRGTGAGTSNYVVFPGNEGLLTILGRE